MVACVRDGAGVQERGVRLSARVEGRRGSVHLALESDAGEGDLEGLSPCAPTLSGLNAVIEVSLNP